MLIITFVNFKITKFTSQANYSSTVIPQKYIQVLQKRKFKTQHYKTAALHAPDTPTVPIATDRPRKANFNFIMFD